MNSTVKEIYIYEYKVFTKVKLYISPYQFKKMNSFY